jgi:hypothetical protein
MVDFQAVDLKSLPIPTRISAISFKLSPSIRVDTVDPAVPMEAAHHDSIPHTKLTENRFYPWMQGFARQLPIKPSTLK